MKSKKWLKIIIKNPKLRQLRTNLRTIIKLAVEDKMKNSDLFRKQLLNPYNNSILICTLGPHCISPLETDRVWNPIGREWMCLNCFNRYLGTFEKINAYKRFLILHSD